MARSYDEVFTNLKAATASAVEAVAHINQAENGTPDERGAAMNRALDEMLQAIEFIRRAQRIHKR